MSDLLVYLLGGWTLVMFVCFTFMCGGYICRSKYIGAFINFFFFLICLFSSFNNKNRRWYVVSSQTSYAERSLTLYKQLVQMRCWREWICDHRKHDARHHVFPVPDQFSDSCMAWLVMKLIILQKEQQASEWLLLVRVGYKLKRTTKETFSPISLEKDRPDRDCQKRFFRNWTSCVNLIPLFYISSFVLMPSPFALSVWSFSAFTKF